MHYQAFGAELLGVDDRFPWPVARERWLHRPEEPSFVVADDEGLPVWRFHARTAREAYALADSFRRRAARRP